MAFQVVHRQRGPTQRLAQRRSKARAHEQGARQTGALCEGHQVDLAAVHAGLAQHLPGQGDDPADVITRRQLRHHTAIGLVHVGLAVQRVREQARHRMVCNLDQRNAGFVAGRLDAEDLQCFSRA